MFLGPDPDRTSLFAAAPATLAPDQLHRDAEAGRVGQAVLATTVVGRDHPTAAARNHSRWMGLDCQA